MITSYHTHTTWSDGRNSVREMVAAGVDGGLDVIGISDHYVMLAAGTIHWSMPIDRLGEYVADVISARDAFADKIPVKLGIEADYVPETAQRVAIELARYPFDYVIGSVHLIEDFHVDEKMEDWAQLSENEVNDTVRTYWVLIRQMADSRIFDIVGHMDLYKKFGFRPSDDLTDDISAALDAIARAGMAVEINTAGLYLPALEAYPSKQILQQCLRRGIPVLATSDSHLTSNITRGQDKARRIASEVGYTSLATFSQRQMTLDPL